MGEQKKAMTAPPNKMVAAIPNKAEKAEENKRAEGAIFPPETRRVNRERS